MKQLPVALNCAKLFAAAALVLFFLTSCTNYWLHAVTCPSANNTELEEEEINGTEKLTGGTQESPLSIVQPQDRPQTSSINKEHSSATGNSTGMNQESFPINDDPVFQQLKQTFKYRPIRGGFTHLSFKQTRVTYHHEGFFWRCWFMDQWVDDTIAKFIFINQPPSKCCIHAYYSPFPNIEGETSAEFNSALVYRRFWSALMFLAVIFITIGFISITFKAFCQNYRMYKAVGLIFLLSGGLFTLSIIMYVCWISAVTQMIKEETTDCNYEGIGVNYGWSFMAAPVGIFFSLIAGLLFIKIAGTAYQEGIGII
ncbi:transmembrane protein 182-like isoform X2 [Heptranchias perlo]|uniref:transmembrane protein 182-like isoform X2 n=1 Tax=Heptranchias perlo TaxID=212740 RepID=UPI0035593EF7